jgi:hypothetical protein
MKGGEPDDADLFADFSVTDEIEVQALFRDSGTAPSFLEFVGLIANSTKAATPNCRLPKGIGLARHIAVVAE